MRNFGLGILLILIAVVVVASIISLFSDKDSFERRIDSTADKGYYLSGTKDLGVVDSVIDMNMVIVVDNSAASYCLIVDRSVSITIDDDPYRQFDLEEGAHYDIGYFHKMALTANDSNVTTRVAFMSRPFKPIFK